MGIDLLDMENYMGKGWKDDTDAIYNTTEVHTCSENKRVSL